MDSPDAPRSGAAAEAGRRRIGNTMTTYLRIAAAPLVIFLLLLSVSPQTGPKEPPPLYSDPSQPVEKRVADLVSRMTLEEKASQMINAAPAIDRLGIPAYEWWNEAL